MKGSYRRLRARARRSGALFVLGRAKDGRAGSRRVSFYFMAVTRRRADTEILENLERLL